MINPEIREAKDELLGALQRYHTLAAKADDLPDRTVLDWIVIYHARNFEEPSASGGEYNVVYADHMQLHSILGLLQMGTDAVDESVSDGSGD